MDTKYRKYLEISSQLIVGILCNASVCPRKKAISSRHQMKIMTAGIG